MRALPLGMSLFLSPITSSAVPGEGVDQLLPETVLLPDTIATFAEKMDCWLRWHVLLAALNQRVESLRVVWGPAALRHLNQQLGTAVDAMEDARKLR